jgi:hypothetical protein
MEARDFRVIDKVVTGIEMVPNTSPGKLKIVATDNFGKNVHAHQIPYQTHTS